MALPGNPFEKRLSERPPALTGTKKVFEKIPLSVGQKAEELTQEPETKLRVNGMWKSASHDSECKQGSLTETQTRNIPVTNPEQTSNKPVINTQKKPVTETQTRNIPVINNRETRNGSVINPEQTSNKPVTENAKLSLENLSHFQLQILATLFEEIQANPYEKETRQLKIEDLALLLGIKNLNAIESLRIVILRLHKFGFVIKTKIKNGRGGWTKYALPNAIFDQLLRLKQMKPVINPEQTSNKPVTKPVIDEPSKLVSNINNNLLTSDQTNQTDLLDLGALNLEGLQKFGISKKQIQDIKNQKLNFTTTTLQNFIDRFLIYTSDSKNIANIKSIPGVFVKMAQLASQGQDPLLDIETDDDRAIRERLDFLRVKQQERQRQKQELIEMEFEEWVSGLISEEVNKIAPPGPGLKSGGPVQKAMLKNFFLETVWPEKTTQL